jgi:hypothetical protein
LFAAKPPKIKAGIVTSGIKIIPDFRISGFPDFKHQGSGKGILSFPPGWFILIPGAEAFRFK